MWGEYQGGDGEHRRLDSRSIEEEDKISIIPVEKIRNCVEILANEPFENRRKM